jgi:hypothetical protein
MSFSGELHDVYREAGAEYSVIRDDGVFSGEYIVGEISTQVTKPFIKEFFREFYVATDTRIVNGDVISLLSTGDKFIVMNIDSEIHEDEVIEKQGVLYKTNVSGQIMRMSGEEWNSQTYEKQIVWNTVKSNVYALVTEPVFGDKLDEQPFGSLEINKKEIYIPAQYNIQLLDRFEVASGEYYMIESIRKRRFPSVWMCYAMEDNR